MKLKHLKVKLRKKIDEILVYKFRYLKQGPC
jgi:hypothetical protein